MHLYDHAVRVRFTARAQNVLTRLVRYCTYAAVLCHPAFLLAQTTATTNSCAKCHADLVQTFGTSPHGPAFAHIADQLTCDTCHGDGKAHTESNGDTSKIQNPAKISIKAADRTCLTCHAAQHPDFAHSAHESASVGCVNCHSIHAGKEAKLLKTAQPALCYQCHAATESAFNAPVHHKSDGGPVKCTACHNPHAVFQTQLQAGIAQQVSACLKCHTEMAGPWVYEHKAIKQAGCVACHTPHGGDYSKLLTEAKVNTICLQCHLPSAFPEEPEVTAAHTPTSTKPCIDCHVAIHGANHENRFVHP